MEKLSVGISIYNMEELAEVIQDVAKNDLTSSS